MGTSTYIGFASAYGGSGGGSTLDCTSTLTVAVGDVLVGLGSWQANLGNTGTIGDSASNAYNNFTMKTQSNDGSDLNMCTGYLIVTNAGTYTFRFNISGPGGGYNSIMVMQFSPPAGGTATFDAGPSAAYATSGAISSGTINTTGTTDEIVAGLVANDNSRTYSSDQIGGVAATGYADQAPYAHMNYRLITDGAKTGIAATVTPNSSCEWGADILAFKVTGGAATAAQAPALQHPRTLTGRGPL
jgi:hypothetical protein